MPPLVGMKPVPVFEGQAVARAQAPSMQRDAARPDRKARLQTEMRPVLVPPLRLASAEETRMAKLVQAAPLAVGRHCQKANSASHLEQRSSHLQKQEEWIEEQAEIGRAQQRTEASETQMESAVSPLLEPQPVQALRQTD